MPKDSCFNCYYLCTEFGYREAPKRIRYKCNHPNHDYVVMPVSIDYFERDLKKMWCSDHLQKGRLL